MHAHNTLAVLLVLLVGLGACIQVPDCNDFDALTTDRDGDGFPEINPPPGVVLDPANTVRVFAANTLTADVLAPFAAEVGVPPKLAEVLAGWADFEVTFAITAEYPGGVIQTMCDTEPLGDFEKRFEAACPLDSQLDVRITAFVPGLHIPFLSVPVGLTTDAVDFSCGQTVSLRTTTDANGHPV